MLARARWLPCLVVATISALSACGPGSFDSNVAWPSLTVSESVFFSDELNGDTPVLYAVMSDRPGLCESFKAGNKLKSTTYVVVGVEEVSVLNPGVFVVGSSSTGKMAEARTYKFDANCDEERRATASGGTVTLDSYEAKPSGGMHGSFNLEFSSEGGTARGSFHAQFCDVDPSGISFTGCL